MNIFFANRFFYPDHSATSQLLTDVAFQTALDHSVHIVTSRQLYGDPAAGLAPEETVHGVHVHRVRTSQFGRGSIFGRALDYFSFYFSAAWRVWRLARAGDVVVAKTDPPLISVPIAVAGWMRGVHQVNWLQDLYPEVAQVLGVGRLARTRGRIATWLRNWSLRRAHYNVVLGLQMRARLLALGVSKQKVRVIPNWSDGSWIRPLPVEGNRLRNEWGLNGEFVVGYSGNMGRVHEFDTIIEAARRLVHRPDIRFLWVGDGAKRKRLREKAEEYGIESFTFRPYQSRENLSACLGAANVHLVSLVPKMEGLIVPSKFYGIAAAGRPTLYVGDPHGEVGQLLARARCGLSVRSGEGALLAEMIEDLAGDPQRCREMGARARALFLAEFDKRIAMDSWAEVLAEVGAKAEDTAPAVVA